MKDLASVGALLGILCGGIAIGLCMNTGDIAS